MKSQIHPRLIERAEPILRAAEGLDDSQRANLFDIYHDATSSTELTGKLNGLSMSHELKAALIAAKKVSDPEPDAIEKIIDAFVRIPKAELDRAEKFPHVLKHLADAGRK